MNSLPSILYVSHTPALKGSAISLGQLILGLDRARFKPVAVFSKPGYWADHLKEQGIRTHVLRDRGFLGWRLISTAKAFMDRVGVDLVHLNSAVPFCKYVGMAARLRRTPVVWHIREDPRSKRVRRLRKWIHLLADRVIVVSTELEQAFGGYPVVKIFNGVDTERFRPDLSGNGFRDRFGIPREAFLFGVVGTVEERKGTLTFLTAAESVLQSAPDARFAVVGDGMPEDMDRVRRFLAGRDALGSRVILTGRLDNIPEVMAGLDVLVMPSLWEGFPRSLIEAMACARAAIASDVGETPFILEDGKSGLLVPRGDQAALVQAMRRCLWEREAMKEMGLRARQRVLARFSLQGHIGLIQARYEELLASRGCPVP
jgi:glycosyltransferase involved in cell wall biosynthesis